MICSALFCSALRGCVPKMCESMYVCMCTSLYVLCVAPALSRRLLASADPAQLCVYAYVQWRKCTTCNLTEELLSLLGLGASVGSVGLGVATSTYHG